MPVGRENDRSPLGHCGHLKLQEVVGSIEEEKGKPQTNALLVFLDRW
jgi:hypothetical protein